MPISVSSIDYNNPFVDLDALREIDESALVPHLNGAWGSLSLNGLETLSGEAARLLSRHRGILALDGLRSISPDAARELSRHEGTILLRGIDLSDAETVSILRDSEGTIVFGQSFASVRVESILSGAHGVFAFQPMIRERTDAILAA